MDEVDRFCSLALSEIHAIKHESFPHENSSCLQWVSYDADISNVCSVKRTDKKVSISFPLSNAAYACFRRVEAECLELHRRLDKAPADAAQA